MFILRIVDGARGRWDASDVRIDSNVLPRGDLRNMNRPHRIVVDHTDNERIVDDNKSQPAPPSMATMRDRGVLMNRRQRCNVNNTPSTRPLVAIDNDNNRLVVARVTVDALHSKKKIEKGSLPVSLAVAVIIPR